MANLYNVPLKNLVQHTLAGTLTQAETGTITLDSSVALELQASSTMKGILVIDRVDVNGVATPAKTEYISFTGVSGSTVTGLTRGLAGTSAQGHAIGAIVEFVADVTWAQAINDVFTTQHNDDGTHKTLSNISLTGVTLNSVTGFNVSLATGSFANFYGLNASIASSTIYNSFLNGNSLVSSNILNTNIDAYTFKSPISNVTQGDIIAFNNNAFERVTGAVNQVLTMTSTASGLLPSFKDTVAGTIFYNSTISDTTGITTTRTLLKNSNISIALTKPAVAEVLAYIDDAFNNTAGSWSYQFANASTLIDQTFPFRPKVANGQNTAAIGAFVSLASGNHVLSIQAITDGNTLTVFKGRVWVKVYPS